ncbi:MAG: hypothetical protein QOI12_486 [Alphaproteobacteria bacterium]|jgi:hypothetical protein|nr:hypothetical protein [Alphaproteobacteria bacterium]
MSERETKIRSVVFAYFPMFIAALSLITSIFNGYLNNKFVDLIQRNLGRAEYMRTCKEIIDAYFQVKFRTGLVSASGERERAGAAPAANAMAEQNDAGAAVNRFAALGTYLANLRDDATRARYTELTRALEKALAVARGTPSADQGKLFEAADTIFAEMNNDCVRSAKE